MCPQTTQSNSSRIRRLRNNHFIVFICYSFPDTELPYTECVCHISILGACLASELIAIEYLFCVFVLFDMFIKYSPLHEYPLKQWPVTALYLQSTTLYWYYSWQVFNAFTDEDWYRQNLWAGRKKAAVTRRAPVTLSEHGREKNWVWH